MRHRECEDEMTMTTKTARGRTTDSPFLYAEECGLSLMKNHETGKKFYVEKGVWTELVSSVQGGWKPWDAQVR